MSNGLSGLRILVVEDEALVSMMIEDMLRGLGCEIVGPAASVAEAMALAPAAALDGALLDVNLAGQPVYPVADALAARGIPFIFVTGYGRTGIDDRYAGVPTLAKPFRETSLASALAAGLLARKMGR